MAHVNEPWMCPSHLLPGSLPLLSSRKIHSSHCSDPKPWIILDFSLSFILYPISQQNSVSMTFKIFLGSDHLSWSPQFPVWSRPPSFPLMAVGFWQDSCLCSPSVSFQMAARVTLSSVNQISLIIPFSAAGSPATSFLRGVLSCDPQEAEWAPSGLLSEFTLCYPPLTHSAAAILPTGLSLTFWAPSLLRPLHFYKLPSAWGALAPLPNRSFRHFLQVLTQAAPSPWGPSFSSI